MFESQKQIKWTAKEIADAKAKQDVFDHFVAMAIAGTTNVPFDSKIMRRQPVEPDVWIECNKRCTVPENRPELKEGSIEIFHPLPGRNITLRRRIESGVMIWEYLM